MTTRDSRAEAGFDLPLGSVRGVEERLGVSCQM